MRGFVGSELDLKGRLFLGGAEHVARRGDTILCEGREVRVFAKKDPENPKRIRAVEIPEDIRAACE